MATSKRGRRAPAVLGAVIAAALVFSGLAAGSAQAASWHVNYGGGSVPLSGYLEVGSGVYPGTFEMEVPKRNSKIKCLPQKGHGYAIAPTGFEYEFTIENCKTYVLSTGALRPCPQEEGPLTLAYTGTGVSISTGSFSFNYHPSEECPLPDVNAVSAHSLELSYPNKEGWYYTINGVGAGTFGGAPMTVKFSAKPAPFEGGIASWGWY